MFKSLYGYTATDETQLNVIEGQTFEFLEVCNKHWWSMRCCESRKVGLVPVSYLTEMKQPTKMVSFDFKTFTGYFECSFRF